MLDHKNKIHDIDLAELFDCDLIIFEADKGIAIKLSEKIIKFFELRPLGWVTEEANLNIVRGFSEDVWEGGRTTNIRDGNGARAIGQGVAEAIVSAQNSKKARSLTGIKLKLRSTDTPEFLISIQDGNLRKSIIEALHQVFQDKELIDPFHHMPESIERALMAQIERASIKTPNHSENISSHATKNLFIFSILIGFGACFFVLYHSSEPLVDWLLSGGLSGFLVAACVFGVGWFILPLFRKLL